MTRAALKDTVDHAIPFTLHVANGRSYDVPDRDSIWLHPMGGLAVVAHPAADGSDEVVGTTIPLLMIIGVTERKRDEG
jgi:hypothetical protein